MQFAAALLAIVLSGSPPKDVPVAAPLPPGVTRPPRSGELAPSQTSGARPLAEDHGSVRIRIRKLAHALAGHLKALPGEGRFQTLAVLPFTEEGDEAKRREVGKLVFAELATDLRRDHLLNLVERERIDAAIHEAYLGELGVVEDKSAVKLGELLSAQALVVGSVSVAGNDFLVNARIVSTETGQVFAAEQERIPAEHLVSFAEEAVVLRTRSGAVFRSILIPGWGQFYNRQEPKGWVFIALEAALLGTALSFHVAGDGAANRYATAFDPIVRDQQFASASDFWTARNTALLAAAAVWAYNVFDAFLNGRSYDPARGGD